MITRTRFEKETKHIWEMAYLYNTHNKDVFFFRPWEKKRSPNDLSIYCLGCTTLTIELKPRTEPLIGVNYDKIRNNRGTKQSSKKKTLKPRSQSLTRMTNNFTY